MDPNTLANTVLIGSAVLLIAAIVYRVGSNLLFPPERETAEETEKEETTIPVVVAEPTEMEPALPEPRRTPIARPSAPPTAAQMMREVAEDQRSAILESANTLIDYAVARGGVSHVRPETLQRMAAQFSLLEATLRKASAGSPDSQGMPPEETRREIFREAFRLLASQARK